MGAFILSHLFYHTVYVIPMNWYLETKLRHDTTEWDVLREGFVRTFIFEYGFESIDDVPQEVKEVIFRIPQDPLELIQLDWSTQLRQVLE